MIIPYGIKDITFKYHTIVVAIYVFVCGYFFLLNPSPSSYFNFQKKDLLIFFPIAICAFIALFVMNRIFHFYTIGVNTENITSILLTLLYSALFAIPEEILFRGIIAKNLQDYFHNIWVAVLMSAVIFGLAHLLNGAHGFWPPAQWDWSLSAGTFIAGLFLAFAYFSTGSLVIPILLHVCFIIAMQVFVIS